VAANLDIPVMVFPTIEEAETRGRPEACSGVDIFRAYHPGMI